MTEDEIQRIFRVPRHAVPAYEVVPVLHTLHKRRADEEQVVKMKAFNRNIKLYLKPTEGILYGPHTPVFTVVPDKQQPRGLRYTKVRNPYEGIGVSYQDVLTSSALILTDLIDGSVEMVGNILNDLFIEPLPHHLKNLLRDKRSINETSNAFDQTHHHIVFKKPHPSHDEVRQGMKLVRRDRVHQERTRRGRSLEAAPDVITPEILVIMDYSLYQTQNQNFKRAVLYLLSFWNAVDLRYRTMSEPRIRLNIAGIIISTKNGGTPFYDNNKREETEVDGDRALQQMSKYFYEEKRFPFSKYDLAMAMTHLDICNMIDSSYCDTTTLGYAYEAGACNRSAIDRNTEAVGLVEDNGGYSGIIPTAHEVGHLLGVPHDGVADAKDCPSYRGFIMTYSLRLGENNFYWSNCTVRLFREFMNSPDGTCLYNSPRRDTRLRTILPGKVLTLDEQCGKVYGAKACKYDESVCTRLECYNPKNGFCKANTAAAEGSKCGENMHCLNGRCIRVNATELAEPPNFENQLFRPHRFPKFQPRDWISGAKNRSDYKTK
ncbi:A disintegrin and metalloproteinase with thrombospondin motifs like isoform X2 [Diachasmimorpha longicaudata]